MFRTTPHRHVTSTRARVEMGIAISAPHSSTRAETVPRFTATNNSARQAPIDKESNRAKKFAVSMKVEVWLSARITGHANNGAIEQKAINRRDPMRTTGAKN